MKDINWKTIATKNTQGNDYELGYEAPATETLLRQIQKTGVLVEVIGGKPNAMPRFIQPDNTDKCSFTPDQKFRIMETNKNFGRFEKILWGESLPESRFDECINWTDPNVWGKRDRGYFLRLSPLLSDEKKEELRENLKDLAVVKGNGISVSGKKNVEALEFTWKCAAEQNNLRTHLRRASNQPISATLTRGIKR